MTRPPVLAWSQEDSCLPGTINVVYFYSVPGTDATAAARPGGASWHLRAPRLRCVKSEITPVGRQRVVYPRSTNPEPQAKHAGQSRPLTFDGSIVVDSEDAESNVAGFNHLRYRLDKTFLLTRLRLVINKPDLFYTSAI